MGGRGEDGAGQWRCAVAQPYHALGASSPRYCFTAVAQPRRDISSVLFPKCIPLVGSLRGIGARLGAAAALRAGDRGGCAAAERMSGDRILEDGGGRRRLGEARALGPSLCSLFALVAGVALGMCGEVPRWARAAVGIAALVVRSQN